MIKRILKFIRNPRRYFRMRKLIADLSSTSLWRANRIK